MQALLVSTHWAAVALSVRRSQATQLRKNIGCTVSHLAKIERTSNGVGVRRRRAQRDRISRASKE